MYIYRYLFIYLLSSMCPSIAFFKNLAYLTIEITVRYNTTVRIIYNNITTMTTYSTATLASRIFKNIATLNPKKDYEWLIPI